jgi:hypothetical protein
MLATYLHTLTYIKFTQKPPKEKRKKQDGPLANNVKLRCFLETIVAVENQ